MSRFRFSNNIIGRREIDPLLLKAQAVLKSYETATGTIVSVLDQTGHSIGEPQYNKILNFCSFCRKYCPDHEKIWDENEYPCTKMHKERILESQRAGGVFIYMCKLGFMFWTSPLFSGGLLAGALVAGGVLGIERAKAAENINALSGGEIDAALIEERLAVIPVKTLREIKSLGQTLLLCAEQVSRDTEDYHETVSRIAEQKSYLSNQIHLINKQYSPGTDSLPEYPLDKERMLLAALRRGDNKTGKKILNEILGALLISSPNNFSYMQLRAIELVVLLSRTSVTSEDMQDDSILETNNRYIKRIQDARNQEELTDILQLIMDRMSGRIFSFQGVRHASALRKAERFIWENYTRKISLREIAGASGLSAPYFSSIFKDEMGENLSCYLNRLRVEKAAAMLIESDLTLCDIASACGFEDQSWFSKIFKNYTGISPGKFRENGGGHLIPEGTGHSAGISSKHKEIG